ncbi:bolA-like protein 1 [Ctenodactylus gundi]
MNTRVDAILSGFTEDTRRQFARKYGFTYPCSIRHPFQIRSATEAPLRMVWRLFSMATRICLSRGHAASGTVGPVEAAIRAKLEQALSPEVLELRNESSGHAVPPGSETHFRVAVVSSRFEGLNLVQRHRLVHAALSEELAGPVHALAIQARTPAQWRENPQLDTSPLCLGGSKKTRGTP